MSFLNTLGAAFGIESKAVNAIVSEPVILPNRPIADIRADIAADASLGGYSKIEIATVFACARVIAEGLAAQPCSLQRPLPGGGYEIAYDHPVHQLISRSPNTWQTAFEWKEWLGFTLALGGNCFNRIIRDASGNVSELQPLPEGYVVIGRDSDGEPIYRLGGTITARKDVWHQKGASLDSVSGVSPQKVAARAIGLASDIETFGANLFKHGSRPSGLLTTDQPISADQAELLKKLWETQNSGLANAHRTALLTNGFKFQPMQTSANEAQFIEARRLQTEEICRVMRVNPVMVFQTVGTASYSSIEQTHIAHLTHTLKPWFTRFEQSAESNLLTREELRAGYRVHIDDRSLSLATAGDRATYYGQMVQNGLMSRNECRELEGLSRSDDPEADKLQPSANLFGPSSPATEKPAD